jgi:hypothetical protein
VIGPAGSELRIDELRADAVRLELLAGGVVSQVRRRDPGERYEVLALGHLVRVRGTHFAVTHEGNGLHVDVAEGVVDVLGADGSELAQLTAPRHWETGVDAVAGLPGESALARPVRSADGVLATVELPTAPRVVAWDFLGADLSAAATLRMRAPPGEHELAALLVDGRRMTATFVVDPLGSRFDPRALRFVGRPPAEARRSQGTLDATAARSVIREAQPALQRCYERSLRNEPATSLKVRMRISLDPRGHVRRIELVGDGATVPPALATCIEQVARRLQFTAPGGDGVVFDAPLAFQPVP